MNLRLLSPLGRSRVVVVIVAFATVSALAVSGCSPEEDPEFTLVLSTDRTSLTEDGSDFAIVRVTVLDQSGNPPSVGSNVLISVSGGGSVGVTGEETGSAFTDLAGTAQFNVACTEVGQLQIIARYEGTTGFLPQVIECRPAPAGDWEILVTADRRLPMGALGNFVIDAIDGEGAPVPVGTEITVEVTAGEIRFQSGTIQVMLTEDPSGRIEVKFIAPDVLGTSTICARFTDARYGGEPTCVGVVIGETEPGPRCDGIFGRVRAPADGETVTQLSFSVIDDEGEPVEGAEVFAEIEAGEFLDDPGDDTGNFEISLATDIDGATITFILSPIEPNSANVIATATFDIDGEETSLDCLFDTNLVFYPEPACEFEPMEPAVLGVSGSSVDERGAIRVCFTDISGTRVAPGKRVEFELLVRTSGVALSTASGLTDSEGCATTQLEAGTQAGIVEIKATLPFGLNESVCTSGPLAIVGARPSEDGFILQCEDEVITGMLSDPLGNRVTADCPLSCWVILRDRFNNLVTHPNARVFFRSEQGTIESPGIPDDQGRVSVLYNPNGAIPVDVDPMPEEPADAVVGLDGRLNNSRDMLVTIMAWTAGEESFIDTSGNGLYDDGEVFTDLPEPYLDVNDDNIFDPRDGDQFVDVETPDQPFDGEWSEGNREWDASTTIWTSTRVLISGDPGSVLDDSNEPDGLIDRDTELIYTPIDRFHNVVSSAISFTTSTDCESVMLGAHSEFVGGMIPYEIYREYIPRTADGLVAPPGSPFAYRTHETRFDFMNMRPAPVVYVPIDFDEEAGSESCVIRLTAEMNVIDGCDYYTLRRTGVWEALNR